MSKLLGIDYGDSKIGVALGNEEINQAWPYRVIKGKTPDNAISEILEIAELEKADKIVIGIPLSLNHKIPDEYFTKKDHLNKQMIKVLAFIKKFKEKLPVSVKLVFEDERLTTKMAGKLKRDLKRNHRPDDDLSAMLILQGYLDRKRYG